MLWKFSTHNKHLRLWWEAVECRGHRSCLVDEICWNPTIYVPVMVESVSISSQPFLIWQNYCHLLLLKLQPETMSTSFILNKIWSQVPLSNDRLLADPPCVLVATWVSGVRSRCGSQSGLGCYPHVSNWSSHSPELSFLPLSVLHKWG